MAARTRDIRHDERTRAKIQTSQLVNRLQSNALGKLKQEMTLGQVRSAIALLKKSMPDLVSTTLTGPDGGAIGVTITPTDAKL